jgi:hypothetical protein
MVGAGNVKKDIILAILGAAYPTAGLIIVSKLDLMAGALVARKGFI